MRNAPARTAAIDPLEAFRHPCLVRAQLVADGEISLQYATDDLHWHALNAGLIHRYSQDQIQQIMAQAFREART
jgi:hypothetical protein